MLTEEEMNQQIRENEGFDESNLFKDEEVDQQGMSRIMGLNNEVDIYKELENRRTKCKYRKDMLEFQYTTALDKYKAYLAKNPHLIKKVTPQTLKKRKLTQKGKSASKRPRSGSSDDSLEEF